MQHLKIAWSAEWAEVPVASEIRAAMESIVQTLSDAGIQTERWLPKDFDLSKILNLYGRISMYLTQRDRFMADIDEALEPWDVWLCPVAATAAFTHRAAWSAVEVNGRSYPHAVANGAYAMPSNLSGHPAVVIPIGQTQNGLPIGMQIVGKRSHNYQKNEETQRYFLTSF